MTSTQVLEAGTTRFGIVNVPNVLYKFFTDESHANALVTRGAIRIGTLYGFRQADEWDAARGDAHEGEFTFSLISETPELITIENAPWFLRPVIRHLGTPIASHGGKLDAVAHHPDSYVYCTTSTCDPAATSGYGSAGVIIRNPPEFFRLLTAHLGGQLRVIALEPHGFAAPCVYLDREVHLGNSQIPAQEPPLAFVKPAIKRTECEVRAVWHPFHTDETLKPVITECPELVNFCERLVR